MSLPLVRVLKMVSPSFLGVNLRLAIRAIRVKAK